MRHIVFVSFGIILIIGGVFFIVIASGIPSIDQITSRKVAESTKIFDKTGTVLLYEISGDQKRTVIPYAEIPETIKNATVAIENENFFNHSAFDWRGILRAVWVDIKERRFAQGGSTLTQQLAKNAFLSTEKTITRKIKELLLAIKIEKYYTKEQILELYLNEIPYGPTAYGIEAAAQTFFGTSAKNLSLAQSAILASLPKAPSYYSPFGSHRDDLFTRQHVVLKKMLDLEMISEKEYTSSLAEKITFAPAYTGMKAPHFVIAIQEYLIQKYGEDAIRNGGLRVITTLDWDLQQQAEKAVLDGAKRNEELYEGKNASLVALDPKTGQILAMAGSRDYFDTSIDGNFNVATQGLRQPGSALKPFVYLTAFERGFTPETVLFDVPTEFSTRPQCPDIPDFSKEDTDCFHPQNFDGTFRGPVAMKHALAESLNIPAVKTLYLAGISNVLEHTSAFGITTLTDPDTYGLSLVLGGGAVRLIDVAEAYGVLAQEGIHHVRTMILEVKDSKGSVIESFEDRSQSVINAQYPRMVNQILSDQDLRAALFHGSLGLTVFPDYDVAMKTGTSNDYRDAWTFGYTPNLVVGVWAGNNDNVAMQKKGSSILAAVPIWSSFMTEALKKYVPETFNRPEIVLKQKDVLNGIYAPQGQLHDILYFVDKRNPEGAMPGNPADDSQFNRWETALQAWITQTRFIPEGGYSQPGTPTITFETPRQGDSIGDRVPLKTIIRNTHSGDIVRIYWNNDPLATVPAHNGSTEITSTLVPIVVSGENILTIEVVSGPDIAARGSITLYKR